MWTPAVRPVDSGPAHARHAGMPAFRPAENAPARPGGETPAHRPGWPGWPVDEPDVPAARRVVAAPATPGPRHRGPRAAAPVSHADGAPPSFLREPIVGPARRPKHAAKPVAPADPLVDTVPMSPPPKHSKPETGPLSSAVVFAIPEIPATGLRTFDLGTVPASVTPPRSWRKAAWFAVGTSAAVVLGLAFATAEFMGRPVDDGALIDALPAYPTGPLTLAELPLEDDATSGPPSTDRPTTSRKPSTSATPSSSSAGDENPPRDTVIGGTSGDETVSPTEPPSEDTTTTPPTTPAEPMRTTVGPAPVTPTDPQKMGDRTEQYFALVTSDPAAAHELTTGGMAREGETGIEARYGEVERIEVQDITIDRNQAVTTSRVKVIHEDGTTTVEERRLTFTWGGDPKITNDSVTG